MNRARLLESTARAAALATLAAAAWLGACDEASSDEHELAAARVVEPVGREIRWDATPAQRFGVSAHDFAGDPATAGASTTAGSTTDAEAEHLHWTTPAGWVERPPAMFRDANFLVAGDERAECYLTTLGGDGGGLEANINRWRSQVSLPPVGAAEIADLPRVRWLDGEAILVDLQGRWTGMMGDEQGEDWRLVGLLQVAPDQSRFLKMVGPAEIIGPQLEAFRALADSFRVDRGSHGEVAAPPEAGVPAGSAAAQPSTPGAEGEERTASLAWRAPPGWTRGPDKPMREVTFVAGAGGRVDCGVTLLGGDGGGLLLNLNRWCGQLGAPELGEADLARLERTSVAGVEGVLVRLERGPDATADAGQELLLGVVALLPERALFVKMTGPRADVEAERAALLELCRSLEVLP